MSNLLIHLDVYQSLLLIPLDVIQYANEQIVRFIPRGVHLEHFSVPVRNLNYFFPIETILASVKSLIDKVKFLNLDNEWSVILFDILVLLSLTSIGPIDKKAELIFSWYKTSNDMLLELEHTKFILRFASIAKLLGFIGSLELTNEDAKYMALNARFYILERNITKKATFLPGLTLDEFRNWLENNTECQTVFKLINTWKKLIDTLMYLNYRTDCVMNMMKIKQYHESKNTSLPAVDPHIHIKYPAACVYRDHHTATFLIHETVQFNHSEIIYVKLKQMIPHMHSIHQYHQSLHGPLQTADNRYFIATKTHQFQLHKMLTIHPLSKAFCRVNLNDLEPGTDYIMQMYSKTWQCDPYRIRTLSSQPSIRHHQTPVVLCIIPSNLTIDDSLEYIQSMHQQHAGSSLLIVWTVNIVSQSIQNVLEWIQTYRSYLPSEATLDRNQPKLHSQNSSVIFINHLKACIEIQISSHFEKNVHRISLNHFPVASPLMTTSQDKQIVFHNSVGPLIDKPLEEKLRQELNALQHLTVCDPWDGPTASYSNELFTNIRQYIQDVYHRYFQLIMPPHPTLDSPPSTRIIFVGNSNVLTNGKEKNQMTSAELLQYLQNDLMVGPVGVIESRPQHLVIAITTPLELLDDVEDWSECLEVSVVAKTIPSDRIVRGVDETIPLNRQSLYASDGAGHGVDEKISLIEQPSTAPDNEPFGKYEILHGEYSNAAKRPSDDLVSATKKASMGNVSVQAPVVRQGAPHSKKPKTNSFDVSFHHIMQALFDWIIGSDESHASNALSRQVSIVSTTWQCGENFTIDYFHQQHASSDNDQASKQSTRKLSITHHCLLPTNSTDDSTSPSEVSNKSIQLKMLMINRIKSSLSKYSKFNLDPSTHQSRSFAVLDRKDFKPTVIQLNDIIPKETASQDHPPSNSTTSDAVYSVFMTRDPRLLRITTHEVIIGLEVTGRGVLNATIYEIPIHVSKYSDVVSLLTAERSHLKVVGHVRKWIHRKRSLIFRFEQLQAFCNYCVAFDPVVDNTPTIVHFKTFAVSSSASHSALLSLITSPYESWQQSLHRQRLIQLAQGFRSPPSSVFTVDCTDRTTNELQIGRHLPTKSLMDQWLQSNLHSNNASLQNLQKNLVSVPIKIELLPFSHSNRYQMDSTDNSSTRRIIHATANPSPISWQDVSQNVYQRIRSCHLEIINHESTFLSTLIGTKIANKNNVQVHVSYHGVFCFIKPISDSKAHLEKVCQILEELDYNPTVKYLVLIVPRPMIRYLRFAWTPHTPVKGASAWRSDGPFTQFPELCIRIFQLLFHWKQADQYRDSKLIALADVSKIHCVIIRNRLLTVVDQIRFEHDEVIPSEVAFTLEHVILPIYQVDPFTTAESTQLDPNKSQDNLSASTERPNNTWHNEVPLLNEDASLVPDKSFLFPFGVCTLTDSMDYEVYRDITNLGDQHFIHQLKPRQDLQSLKVVTGSVPLVYRIECLFPTYQFLKNRKRNVKKKYSRKQLSSSIQFGSLSLKETLRITQSKNFQTFVDKSVHNIRLPSKIYPSMKSIQSNMNHALKIRSVSHDIDLLHVVLGPVVGTITTKSVRILLEINMNLPFIECQLKSKFAQSSNVKPRLNEAPDYNHNGLFTRRVDGVIAFQIIQFDFDKLLPGTVYEIYVPDITVAGSVLGRFKTIEEFSSYAQIAVTGAKAMDNNPIMNLLAEELMVQQSPQLMEISLLNNPAFEIEDDERSIEGTAATQESGGSYGGNVQLATNDRDELWRALSKHLCQDGSPTTATFHLGVQSMLSIYIRDLTQVLMNHTKRLELPLSECNAVSSWYYKQFEEIVKDTFRFYFSMIHVRKVFSSSSNIMMFHSDYLLPTLRKEWKQQSFSDVNIENKKQTSTTTRLFSIINNVFDEQLNSYVYSLYGWDRVTESNHFRTWRHNNLVVIIADIVSNRQSHQFIERSIEDESAPDKKSTSTFSPGFFDKTQWKAIRTIAADRTISHLVILTEEPILSLKKVSQSYNPSINAERETVIPWDPTVSDLEIFFNFWINWLDSYNTGEVAASRNVSLISTSSLKSGQSRRKRFYDGVTYSTIIEDSRKGLKIHQFCLGDGQSRSNRQKDVHQSFSSQDINPINHAESAESYFDSKDMADDYSDIVFSSKLGNSSIKYMHQVGNQDFVQYESYRSKSSRYSTIDTRFEMNVNALSLRTKLLKEKQNFKLDDDLIQQLQIALQNEQPSFAVIKFWFDSWKGFGIWSTIQPKKLLMESSDSAIIVVGPILGTLQWNDDSDQRQYVSLPVLIEVDISTRLVIIATNVFTNEVSEIRVDIVGGRPHVFQLQPLELDTRYNVKIIGGLKKPTYNNTFVVNTQFSSTDTNVFVINCEPLKTESSSSSFLTDIIERNEVPFHGISAVVHTNFQPDLVDFIQTLKESNVLKEHVTAFLIHKNISPSFREELKATLEMLRGFYRTCLSKPTYRELLRTSHNLLMQNLPPTAQSGDSFKAMEDEFEEEEESSTVEVGLSNNSEVHHPRSVGGDGISIEEETLSMKINRLLWLMVARLDQEYFDQFQAPQVNVYRAVSLLDTDVSDDESTVDSYENNKSIERKVDSSFAYMQNETYHRIMNEDISIQSLALPVSAILVWSKQSRDPLQSVLVQWIRGLHPAPPKWHNWVSLNKKVSVEQFRSVTDGHMAEIVEQIESSPIASGARLMIFNDVANSNGIGKILAGRSATRLSLRLQNEIAKWIDVYTDREVCLISPFNKMGTVRHELKHPLFETYLTLYLLDTIYRNNEYDMKCKMAEKHVESQKKKPKQNASAAMSKRAQIKKEEDEKLRLNAIKREVDEITKHQLPDGYLLITCQSTVVMAAHDSSISDAFCICKSNVIPSFKGGDKERLDSYEDILNGVPGPYDLMQLPDWIPRLCPSTEVVFVLDNIWLYMNEQDEAKELLELLEDSGTIVDHITPFYERSALSELSRPIDMREIDMDAPGTVSHFLTELTEELWHEVVPLAIRSNIFNLCDDFIRSYCYSKAMGENLKVMHSAADFAKAFQYSLILSLAFKTAFKWKDLSMHQQESVKLLTALKLNDLDAERERIETELANATVASLHSPKKKAVPKKKSVASKLLPILWHGLRNESVRAQVVEPDEVTSREVIKELKRMASVSFHNRQQIMIEKKKHDDEEEFKRKVLEEEKKKAEEKKKKKVVIGKKNLVPEPEPVPTEKSKQSDTKSIFEESRLQAMDTLQKQRDEVERQNTMQMLREQDAVGKNVETPAKKVEIGQKAKGIVANVKVSSEVKGENVEEDVESDLDDLEKEAKELELQQIKEEDEDLQDDGDDVLDEDEYAAREAAKAVEETALASEEKKVKEQAVMNQQRMKMDPTLAGRLNLSDEEMKSILESNEKALLEAFQIIVEKVIENEFSDGVELVVYQLEREYTLQQKIQLTEEERLVKSKLFLMKINKEKVENRRQLGKKVTFLSKNNT